MISMTLKRQIESYCERHLVFFNDLEIFRWTALVEEKIEHAKQVVRPTHRVLVRDASEVFE